MKINSTIAAIFIILAPLAAARGEVVVPDDFKNIVPLYPGAKVLIAMNTEEGTQVHLESPAVSKAIIDFYRDAMQKKGWEVEGEMMLAEGGTIIMNKAEKKLTVITFENPGKDTTVVLSLGSQ